jgi:hypothetical protein
MAKARKLWQTDFSKAGIAACGDPQASQTIL